MAPEIPVYGPYRSGDWSNDVPCILRLQCPRKLKLLKGLYLGKKRRFVRARSATDATDEDLWLEIRLGWLVQAVPAGGSSQAELRWRRGPLNQHPIIAGNKCSPWHADRATCACS